MKYHITCNEFTVLVIVKANIITEAPPIVRKFIGQDIGALLHWVKKNFTDVKVKRVND